jgi:hypothetical protein
MIFIALLLVKLYERFLLTPKRLISGDQDLLVLHRWRGIAIMTPA